MEHNRINVLDRLVALTVHSRTKRSSFRDQASSLEPELVPDSNGRDVGDVDEVEDGTAVACETRNERESQRAALDLVVCAVAEEKRGLQVR